MGFQQGLSGLNASSKSLDVIGNNIANANTVGAKTARAEFADVYANALGGSATTIGLGVSVAAVAQQFTQGTITATDNPLDVAINGNGFFEVKSPAGAVQLHAQRPVQDRYATASSSTTRASSLMGYRPTRPAPSSPARPARCRCRPAASRRR